MSRSWSILKSYFIITILSAFVFFPPITAIAGLTFTGIKSDEVDIILVEGDFNTDDDISRFLEELIISSATVVTFNSSGGNPYKAMELGRLIRKLGLGTIQLRSKRCDSACALAFMGGQIRISEPGAIGVHRTSFTNSYIGDINSAATDIQVVTKDILSYLIEMDIEPALMEIFLQYDSNDIRHLSGSEMAKFNVTNTNDFGTRNKAQLTPRITAPHLPTGGKLPIAKSGYVRHPKGQIELKLTRNQGSESVAILPNKTRVEIIDNSKNWYKIVTPKTEGYAHHTWIKVNQFVQIDYDMRFIQIKSFAKYENAIRFVKNFTMPTSVFLTSNNWFAITLKRSQTKKEAQNQIKQLKAAGMIPKDSLITYGNTYRTKLCCSY